MNEAVGEMVNTAGVIKCPVFILCTSLKYFESKFGAKFVFVETGPSQSPAAKPL